MSCFLFLSFQGCKLCLCLQGCAVSSDIRASQKRDDRPVPQIICQRMAEQTTGAVYVTYCSHCQVAQFAQPGSYCLSKSQQFALGCCQALKGAWTTTSDAISPSSTDLMCFRAPFHSAFQYVYARHLADCQSWSVQDGGDAAANVIFKFDPHKDYYKVRPSQLSS